MKIAFSWNSTFLRKIILWGMKFHICKFVLFGSNRCPKPLIWSFLFGSISFLPIPYPSKHHYARSSKGDQRINFKKIYKKKSSAINMKNNWWAKYIYQMRVLQSLELLWELHRWLQSNACNQQDNDLGWCSCQKRH